MSLFEIKNRWNGEVRFRLECESFKICVETFIKKEIEFKFRANLTRANLTGADLTRANLTDADLTDADLTRANLTDADLTDANLTRANLTDADLTRADLTRANLTRADLTRANLTRADLTRANLTRADLTVIRDDIWAVLSASPKEVPALIVALKNGKVDGSTYSGECSCLVGTLSNAKGISPDDFENKNDLLRKKSSRPAERFFMGINEGDTPENNKVSALALEWSELWIKNMKEAFSV